MDRIILILLAVLCSSGIYAQEVIKDTVDQEIITEQGDTITSMVELEEVIIYKDKLDAENLRQYRLLQARVYKVYPYAKIASERLTMLDRNMAKLKTEKEKRKYFKIVENYIENEFTGKLKKLSRKQGQILVKLIFRQTGHTTFDLVKDYKSGWKAFWASNTAKLFDINLKTKYDPYQVNEDYLIETILQRAFENGRLTPQQSAIVIDYGKLSEQWLKRAEDAEARK